jgi:hypothetical protein
MGAIKVFRSVEEGPWPRPTGLGAKAIGTILRDSLNGR